MACRYINLGNGVTGLACSRGIRVKRCKECGRPSTKQCDFPLRGNGGKGRTCDVYLCDGCAIVVGSNRDYCPPHSRLTEHERDDRSRQRVDAQGDWGVTRHICHAVDCARAIPPKLLMCPPHWYTLPKPAQRTVWHHYRPGQERDKQPSAHYLLAQGVAVVLVAFLGRTWSARQALDRLAEVCLRAANNGIRIDDIEQTCRAMGCEQIAGQKR